MSKYGKFFHGEINREKSEALLRDGGLLTGQCKDLDSPLVTGGWCAGGGRWAMGGGWWCVVRGAWVVDGGRSVVGGGWWWWAVRWSGTPSVTMFVHPLSPALPLHHI